MPSMDDGIGSNSEHKVTCREVEELGPRLVLTNVNRLQRVKIRTREARERVT
jgi:hypothetical protein